MSAAKTGTPAALSCSAISCRVLVLPVPVAPATRPCRLSMPSGIRMWVSVSVGGVEHQAAELERRTLERVARRDRLDQRVGLGRRCGRCLGGRGGSPRVRRARGGGTAGAAAHAAAGCSAGCSDGVVLMRGTLASPSVTTASG